MEVLLCLARHSGETLAKERLLQEVWPGTFVSDDALKRCILELRRAFEDDARDPQVIQTVAKRGYRLVAPVQPINSLQTAGTSLTPREGAQSTSSTSALRLAMLALAAAVLLVAGLGALNVGGIRRWLRVGNAPQVHSIAVLPLRSLSADPDQEYFSDGLTDALITDLAQIDSLAVISHTSTMQYKNAKKTLPEIARELNVDGIIEGTLQRSGNRVRITAQLIYAPADKHVWANTYERDMRDLFALEREVTEDIARQVQARLTTPQQGPLSKPKQVDPNVLEAYLEGNYHLGRFGEGGGQEEQQNAAEYFKHAIDADPNFAPAYVGLAKAHMELMAGSSKDVDIRQSALEKALQLDSNNPEARVWLGWLKWQPLLDWKGSETEFRQAISVSPSNLNAHSLYGLLLVTLGRKDEGVRECQLAERLDPNQDNLSFCLYLAHDFDGSIAMLRRMDLGGPNHGERHCFLSQDYMQKGMQKEAVLELEQCYSLFGLSQVADSIRHGYATAGYGGAIQQWARALEHLQDAKQGYFPGNLATAYTILGDKDRAFHWLDEAYQHREMVSADGGIFFLPVEPMYEPLRSDPRYTDLVRRVGLPPSSASP